MLRTPISINLTSSHPSGIVPFNETMILDASQTVDKDYKNSILSISWSFKDGELKQEET
jgi:predicted thioredoxin/glutaredoxin